MAQLLAVPEDMVHPLSALFLLVLIVFLMIYCEIPFSFEVQALSDWLSWRFF